ncbi:hypothetical protein CDL15_Pgr015433 [Punica granatum]|uniref:Uncharacterized protein n=1 Tax=Punica granatum TaxID=22663 RepID=A0A218VZJ6_PUNGR|nr:hypothetical protein CDL15_Pgr015433 [Punica granatum]
MSLGGELVTAIEPSKLVDAESVTGQRQSRVGHCGSEIRTQNYGPLVTELQARWNKKRIRRNCCRNVEDGEARAQNRGEKTSAGEE